VIQLPYQDARLPGMATMGRLYCHAAAKGDTLARLHVNLRSRDRLQRLKRRPHVMNGTLPRDVARCGASESEDARGTLPLLR
jgi:hypothetical protein